MPDPIPAPPLRAATGFESTSANTPTRDSTQDPDRTSGFASSDGVALPGVPGYEIVGVLGRGGMGVVYEARQLALKRMVALKMIRAAAGASAGEIARFVAEAEAVAAVRHPNVVQVFECGEHDGLPYMALELLPGGSLAARLRSQVRLETASVAELVAKIADGVQAAHEQRIVHRDLKPGNVLLDEAGEPKVTDFGIAHRGSSDLTATGAVVGTPNYMAPEQAAGRAKFVGPAADIYAIGVILFECLTGTVPFKGPDTWSIIRQVVSDPPPRPRSVSPSIPRDLELICLKCLSKEPHERYATAADLADDLRRYLDGKPVTARPLGVIPRAWRAMKRNPVITGAVAAVMLSSAIGTVVSLVKAGEAEQSAADAIDALGKAKASLAAQLAAEAQKDAASIEKEAALQNKLTAESQKKRIAETVVYAREVQTAFELLEQGDVPGAERALATCQADLRGWEWRLLTRWLARRSVALPRPTDPLTPLRVAVSLNGRWVAAAGQEREPQGAPTLGRAFVWLWDLKAGTSPVKLAGQFVDVYLLAFDAGGTKLAAFGDIARVWNVAEPSTPRLISRNLPGSRTIAARFTPAGLMAVQSGVQFNDPALLLIWRNGANPPEVSKLPQTMTDAAAIAPDGKTVLLSGTLPGPVLPGGPPTRSSARLFRIDGEPVAEPVAFEGVAASAGFSADGKNAVIAAQGASYEPERDASLVLVRWDDRKPGTRIRLGEGEARNLEIRADGKVVIASGLIGFPSAIRVWDPSTGQVATTAKFSSCGGVGIFSEGRLAVGDYRTGVCLWNPVELHDRSFGGGTETLGNFALLPGDRLVAASEEGQGANKPARLITQGLGGGPAEVFVPDPAGRYVVAVARVGNRLAVSLESGKTHPVLLIDPVAKSVVHRWHHSVDALSFALTSDPAGRRVAFGIRAYDEKLSPLERGIKIHNAASGALERELPIPAGKYFPTALAFDPHGKHLAAALSAPVAFAGGGMMPEPAPGVVVVWNADTGEEVWVAREIRRGMNDVAFSPDGTLLAGCGGDQRVRIWQTANGKLLDREFPVPSPMMTGTHGGLKSRLDSIVFIPDGTRLAAVGEHSFLLWDVATGQPVATFPLGRSNGTVFGKTLAFTPDGRQLIMNDALGKILAFDAGPP